MATGSGKTFTAVSFVYRLVKHAKARRVLFLVDPGGFVAAPPSEISGGSQYCLLEGDLR